MRVSRPAAINIFVGASGTGKSYAIKRALADAPADRLIVCDPDGEYDRHGARVLTLARARELARLDHFQVVFSTSDDLALGVRQFAFLCSLAWCVAADEGRPVTFVCDELSDFATPWVVPAAWRRLVKRGRKHGVTILAGAQRPAEIDKTIWSNASTIRAGRLNSAADQTTIARALNLPVQQVAALAGHAWIELDRTTGKMRQGV